MVNLKISPFLDQLKDVTITSVADNELLTYDNSTSEWINQTPTEAGLDSIYLKLDGSNANTNINIGAYDFTTSGTIEAGKLQSTNSVASGIQSLAWGGEHGYYGTDTTASGNYAIALGVGSEATATSAIALGDYTHVHNDYGIGIGTNCIVDGGYGIAIGYEAEAGADAITIGYSFANDTANSIALGINAKVLEVWAGNAKVSGAFETTGTGTFGTLTDGTLTITGGNLTTTGLITGGDLLINLANSTFFVDELSLFGGAVKIPELRATGVIANYISIRSNLYIRSADSTTDPTIFMTDDDVSALGNMAYDISENEFKFFNIDGVRIEGDLKINFDNKKIMMGATNTDIQIFSDGTNGIIDVATALRLGNSVTNYVNISATGDTTFVGSAGFYPRLVRQDAEPANGTGTTQIDDEELIMWIDTNDSNRVYLMFNDNTNTNIVKIELT